MGQGLVPAFGHGQGQSGFKSGGSTARPALTHTFEAITDDGMRVYLDDVLGLYKCCYQAPRPYTFVRTFATPGFDSINLWLSDGNLRLTMNGESGWTYRIDGTTNFMDWLSLTNFPSPKRPVAVCGTQRHPASVSILSGGYSLRQDFQLHLGNSGFDHLQPFRRRLGQINDSS